MKQAVFILTLASVLLLFSSPARAVDDNHDGMDDAWQERYGVAPFAGGGDLDEDGRINLVEFINMSHPRDAAHPDAGLGIVFVQDQNHDLLDDRWAVRYGVLASDAALDPDNDGRTNLEESIVGSSPWEADVPWSRAAGEQGQGALLAPNSFRVELATTVPGWRYRLLESDTLSTDSWTVANVAQGEAVQKWGTGGPIVATAVVSGTLARKFYRWAVDDPDGDGDSLSDWSELRIGSDPANADSDGDGFKDDEEYWGNSDPTNQASVPSLGTAEPERDPVDSKAFGLIGATKVVYASWHEPQMDQGLMSWFDDDGHQGGTNDNLPDWSGAYQELSYPGEFESFNMLGLHKVGHSKWQRVVVGGLPDYNWVSIAHYKIAMIADSALPWPRHHKFLIYDYASSFDAENQRNYSNLRYINFWVKPKKSFSKQVVELNPQTELGKSKGSEITSLDFYVPPVLSYAESYALDTVSAMDGGVPQPWVMIPQGKQRLFALWFGVSDSGTFYLRASGGGVTPDQSEQASYFGHNYTSAEAGDSGILRVGVGNPDDVAQAMTPELQPDVDHDLQHVVRFTVKKERKLKVVIHPIGLAVPAQNGQLEVLTTPQYLPSQETIEEYLNDIFYNQANIKVVVDVRNPIWFNWDVGLGENVLPSQPGRSSNNQVLDAFFGWGQLRGLLSGEEELIINEADTDLSASVNAYYVAAPNAGRFNGWTNERYQTEGNAADLAYGGFVGWAGPAVNNHQSRAVFVVDHMPDPANTPDVMWTIAHELGHAVGKLPHTCGAGTEWNNPNHVGSSDNEDRLMTGRYGLKRAQGPLRLIKYEWDELHKFQYFGASN